MKRRKFTVEEFYRMVPACILGEDTLEELIDGDVMVRAYQNRRHSNAVSELMRLFILSPMPSLYPSAHCPIRFDDYNEPVADIVLLAKEFESAEHPGPNDLTLAVEIADTEDEFEYDRNAKLPLYARYGLQEVWLVSTTVAVNDDVKLRQLSVDEVRLWQSAGMRLRRWPVGPRASIRYTSA